MRFGRYRFRNIYRAALGILAAVALGMGALALVNCGNTKVTGQFNKPGMGSATVTVSDPPSCATPSGNFEGVFISIRSVQANISNTADDNSPGWQELAPQLNSNPMQVNLLALPANGQCLLQQLGSTSSLPAGDYQQIRLLLVPNNPASGPTPSTNACARLGQVFNCVEASDGSFQPLDLSSQADTGLKIPPGQVLGGPIHVAAGQSVDINVDFNACASLVEQGNGQFRLKPVLTGGVVSPNTTGISATVVDSSGKPIAAGRTGQVLVALEQPDGNGVDHIFMQAATDSNGNFRFCPLPSGAVFDVVAVAINGAGTAYNATAALNVPGGTALGNIPLVAETGSSAGPGTIQGFVTAVNGTTGADIDVAMSALEPISLSGGGTRQIAIPLESTTMQSSTPSLAVSSSMTCPSGVPTGAFCAEYTLVVPASNPSAGAFSAGSVSFAAPAPGDVLYGVGAQARKPMSGGASICSQPFQTVNQDTAKNPLKATASATVTAKEIDFSGCM